MKPTLEMIQRTYWWPNTYKQEQSLLEKCDLLGIVVILLKDSLSLSGLKILSKVRKKSWVNPLLYFQLQTLRLLIKKVKFLKFDRVLKNDRLLGWKTKKVEITSF